jgi:Protein of unknown function (DUF3300)
MKRSQMFLAWLSTFLLVNANLAWEGCGAKESSPAPEVQKSPAGASAPQQDSAAVPVTNAAATQIAAVQQQQLPEVILTTAGLDELLAPIALYPDPVLAVMLHAAVNPQQVMDGGNWLVLDQNRNLKEAALDEDSKKAGFTPVMQALLHYPTVVDLMLFPTPTTAASAAITPRITGMFNVGARACVQKSEAADELVRAVEIGCKG